MHYRRPDVQAEVLLHKSGIGIDSPEAPSAQGEVANIRVVEVAVVFDLLDCSFCSAVFQEKRSVKLFAVYRPVLVVIACAFAFGATLLSLPFLERILSHSDVDMAFD